MVEAAVGDADVSAFSKVSTEVANKFSVAPRLLNHAPCDSSSVVPSSLKSTSSRVSSMVWR